jgi:sugar phosphate isomerase/epimerase
MASRRRFIKTAGAVGGGLLLGPAMLRAQQPKQDKYGGFLMGIQSYSLRGFDADTAIKHAAELGLGHVEFYEAHFSVASSDAEIAKMKQKMKQHGLQMMGHGVNRFTKDHAANRGLFEFAKKAGIKNISAAPDGDSFESLDKLVAEYDIRIAIHNHGPDHMYDTVLDVKNAIKSHHPNIGACADLGHFIRSGEDPVEVIRVLNDRLYGIHLKDFAEQKKNAQGVILGKGHLDVVAVFDALRRVKFPQDGCLSLEYEENPKDPLGEIRQCLEVASTAAWASQ